MWGRKKTSISWWSHLKKAARSLLIAAVISYGFPVIAGLVNDPQLNEAVAKNQRFIFIGAALFVAHALFHLVLFKLKKFRTLVVLGVASAAYAALMGINGISLLP